VISGFRSEVDENCALLGRYAASSGNLLPAFRDNLSVPSSGVKKYYPPISFYLVWSTRYYLLSSTHHKSSRYVFFLTPLLYRLI